MELVLGIVIGVAATLAYQKWGVALVAKYFPKKT